MQTLYFVLMVALVGALMVWSVLPDRLSGRFWWPFDMKEDPVGTPDADAPLDAPSARGSSWRERAARGAEGSSGRRQRVQADRRGGRA